MMFLPFAAIGALAASTSAMRRSRPAPGIDRFDEIVGPHADGGFVAMNSKGQRVLRRPGRNPEILPG